MNAFECYELVRALNLRLGREGYESVATDLSEFISTTFSGTEILMGLRWKLGKFVDSDPMLTSETMKEARYVLACLDELLGHSRN